MSLSLFLLLSLSFYYYIIASPSFSTAPVTPQILDDVASAYPFK
jgi:hypothetical protein